MPQPKAESRHQSETPVATPGSLSLRIVDNLADLEAMEAAWNATLAASETRTPFMSHSWVRTWWESFGATQALHVVVLSDEAGLAAIAPLARARRGLSGLGYTALELIGSGPLPLLGMGLNDRSDLILARRRDECVKAILEHLAAERRLWDIVDLRFVPHDGTTARVLRELASASGLGLWSEVWSESPYLKLDGTYDEYLASRSRNFRKNLKRKERRLAEQGEVSLYLDAARTDPLGALRSAASVSLASWKRRTGSALFMHANVCSFLERLVPRLATQDSVYLAILKVNGEPAAHELGFRMDNKLWSYDSAFMRGFAEGSPGVLLTAHILEHAWAEGLSEYDFMRGDEEYKTAWNTKTRRELQLVLHNGSARSRTILQIAYRAKSRLRNDPRAVALHARVTGAINRLRSSSGN